ncbi:MAG: UvrD-helicase domain-containing protein [Chloroflexi bacterium]|nr:UvrD-helicase domain-containing protein [Chloroflexota bacterium]
MNPTENLTPEQLEAVRHTDGPLLILAGAGSGKTRVLAHRIARLVKEEGVPPGNILAVTFTNKAAREMKERIHRLAGRKDFPYIGTFHSLCARILRSHLPDIGFPGNFAIYDERDSRHLVKEALNMLNLDERRFPPKMVKSLFSLVKIQLGKRPPVWDERLENLYNTYEELLRKNQALDFDDLLKKTVEMLIESPDILKHYRDKFRYILVDEFQDVNYCQYVFLKLISEPKKNICVVGDDDQSIYGFRGADSSIILNYRRDFPGVKIVKLEQNFRSTQPILQVANALVTMNSGRMEKELWCTREGGDPVFLFRASDAKEEAKFVVRTIKTLQSEGYTPDQCAILFRINAQSRVFEESCIQGGINYLNLGGVRFFDRVEIRDILAVMKLLVNPFDKACLRRASDFALPGIGAKRLDIIYRAAEETGGDMLRALVSEKVQNEIGERAAQSCRSFYNVMERLRAEMPRKSPHEFIKIVLDSTGYKKRIEEERTAEAVSRLENIEELISQAREFEETHPGSDLTEYLNEISLYTDIDSYDPGENAVTMMTLHSAKGLEFPVVFLTGMEEGLLPHMRSLDSSRDIEEERRLTYVGITRGKKKLFLSWAERRTIAGSAGSRDPSRFLAEIPRELLKKIDPVIPASKQGIVRVVKSAPSPGEKREWKPGDQVVHSLFGEGVVLSASGNSVRVDFGKKGEKVLRADFIAPKNSGGLAPGKRVEHKQLGKGILQNISGGVAEVIFSGGTMVRVKSSDLSALGDIPAPPLVP